MSSQRGREARGLTDQRGAIGVGTVILLALGAAFVYLLLAAFDGDSAHFGRAPIPSSTQIELPEGETDVYYFEAVEADPDLPLVTPKDLAFTVTGPDGVAVRVDSRGGDTEEADGGSARLVGAVLGPEEGVYEVTVSSNEAAGRSMPQLTFGQSPTQAVEDRFESLVDELKGPVGIVVLGVLIGLALLPSLRRASRAG